MKNNGPSDATGVKTTYYLPYGLKRISISSNSYNPFNGLWTIGNLTSGSTVSLEITVKTGNVGLINNTVTVSGNQTDPYTANNNANVLLNVYPNPWSPLGNPGNPGNGGSGSNNYKQIQHQLSSVLKQFGLDNSANVWKELNKSGQPITLSSIENFEKPKFFGLV